MAVDLLTEFLDFTFEREREREAMERKRACFVLSGGFGVESFDNNSVP